MNKVWFWFQFGRDLALPEIPDLSASWEAALAMLSSTMSARLAQVEAAAVSEAAQTEDVLWCFCCSFCTF